MASRLAARSSPAPFFDMASSALSCERQLACHDRQGDSRIDLQDGKATFDEGARIQRRGMRARAAVVRRRRTPYARPAASPATSEGSAASGMRGADALVPAPQQQAEVLGLAVTLANNSLAAALAAYDAACAATVEPAAGEQALALAEAHMVQAMRRTSLAVKLAAAMASSPAAAALPLHAFLARARAAAGSGEATPDSDDDSKVSSSWHASA